MSLLMTLAFMPANAFAVEGGQANQVSTVEELVAALAQGGEVILASDIAVNQTIHVEKDASIIGQTHILTRADNFAGDMIAVKGATLYMKSMALDGANVLAEGQLIDLTNEATVVLETVTAKNNAATVAASTNGGAVYVHEGCNLIAKDAAFCDNQASGNGGALYVQRAYVFMEDGLMTGNNSQVSGGAMYATGSTVNITGTNISENYAQANGGSIGVYSDSNVKVDSVNVKGNSAGEHGGAVIINKATFTAFNSTFESNENNKLSGTSKFGGAIYCSEGAVLYAYGSSFLKNKVTGEKSNGGAIDFYVESGTAPIGTIQNCLFEENSTENFGGAIFATKKATVNLYDITARNNSAGTGGYFYFTTTGTTVNMNGLTLSGNKATTSPDLHSNTNKTIANVAGEVTLEGVSVAWSDVIGGETPALGTAPAIPAAPANPFGAHVTIAPIDEQAYTGEAVTPGVQVEFDGVTANPSDYDLIYSENVDKGTAKVLAVAKSNKIGVATRTFQIKEYAATVTVNGVTTNCESIEEAIDSIAADGVEATVTLLKDTKIDSLAVATGKNISIDFNKKTLTADRASLAAGSTVTLKNGTLNATNNTESLIENYSNLTIEKMAVNAAGANAIVAIGGTASISGDTVSGDISLAGGKLAITGGSFEGAINKTEAYTVGDAEISGGTFKTDVNEFAADGFAITVDENGNYVAKTEAAALAELKARVAELEASVTSLEASVETLNEQVTNLNTEKQALETQITGLSSTITDLESQVETLTEDNNLLTQSNASLQNRISDLGSQITKLYAEKASLESDNATLVENITSLEGQVKAYEEKVTALETAKEALETQVGNITTENSQLNEQIKTLNATIEELNTTAETLAEENNALMLDANEKQSTIKALNDTLNEAHARVEELITENNLLMDSIKEKDALIAKLQAQNTLLDNPIKAKVSISGTAVTVSWNTIEGAKYVINGTTVTATSKKYTVSLGSSKKFTIKAVMTVNGEKIYGKAVSVTAKSAPKKVAAPTVTNKTTKTVKATWTKATGASYYQVSISTSKTGTKIVNSKTTKLSYSKGSLTKGKTYYVKVRAVGANGVKGAWSTAKAIKVTK